MLCCLVKTHWRAVLAATLVAAFGAAQVARANESYYLIVFAAQRDSKAPRYTHSFATFVKATGEGTDGIELEHHTISWIAATKEVVLARTRPEPGVNLSLRDSLRLAASLDEQVSMWGPFEIRKSLYDRALMQIERLESRTVQYKALDGRFRPETALNCIHAISDLESENGLLDTAVACGEDASRMIVEHLRRWMIKSEGTQHWVAERLGLEESVVKRRSLDQ